MNRFLKEGRIVKPEASPTKQSVEDMIHVFKPKPNDTVDPNASLVVEGEVRGNWFFEATSVVRLLDKADNELYVGFVEAGVCLLQSTPV